MVKLNLNCEEKNIDMGGKAVIAIVMDPEGHAADAAALMIGSTSPHDAAIAMGEGIGSILSQPGKNTFNRVTLAQLVIDQIKDSIDGNDISKKDIFEGTVDEFMAKGRDK